MNYFKGYEIILLFIIGALCFAFSMLLISKWLRPHKPTEDKLATYESGEEPMDHPWGVFNIRFFIIILVFVIFEAEIIFLFPWAVIFGDKNLIKESNHLWSQFSLVEVFLFIGILAVGLGYVWKNRMLEWIIPQQKPINFVSPIPKKIYKQFNEKQENNKHSNTTS